jgi:hypothetical protein
MKIKRRRRYRSFILRGSRPIYNFQEGASSRSGGTHFIDFDKGHKIVQIHQRSGIRDGSGIVPAVQISPFH